jgi:2-keto-4-pentenoate hydratase/2-oxohepta-3-ene-1,7-dioic acid hydratase in catechol pathway
MKLLRYGPAGQEKPGLLDRDGKIRDLSGAVRDIDGETLSPASLDRLRRLDPSTLPLVPETPRLGPCVARVSKLVAIGLNYRAHAAETGAAIPKEPIFFMKATTSICGPDDDVIIPKGSQKTDWEVELGIVIGTLARYVPAHDAYKHIAGYCIVNDVSEREFQIERGGQWTKGKSADTFAPIGPWVVTADEVPDPGKLGLWTEVNGRRVQNSNTSDLIFGIDQHRQLCQPFHDLAARRHHPDRHAVGCRSRHEAAAIPQTWRPHAAFGRGFGRAKPASGGL